MAWQIYIIENNSNKKKYIGLSKGTFEFRYGKHWWNNVLSRHLQSELMEYGKDNFTIIENYQTAQTLKEAKKLENQYIEEFKTRNMEFGYNNNEGQTYKERLSPRIKDSMYCFTYPQDAIDFKNGLNKYYLNFITAQMFSKKEEIPELIKRYHESIWIGEDFEKWQKLLKEFIKEEKFDFFRIVTGATALGVQNNRFQDIVNELF